MTISVRALKEGGKVGAREAVTHYAHRAEIGAIGFAFLDLARRMAPETMWARSDTVASRSKAPAIFPLTVSEHRAHGKYLDEVGPTVVRDVAVTFDKLRKRMPILQRMQHTLERVDDDTAAQLDMLLTMLEHTGTLPFQMISGVLAPARQAASDEPPQGSQKH